MSVECSAIDWTATGTMLSGIGTIVGAGAVAFAAVIGRITFEQWRRQKQEERRMAVAEEVLVLAYKLKEAFSAIRSPGMWPAEIDEVEEKLRERGIISKDAKRGTNSLLTWAQGVLSRIDRYQDDFMSVVALAPVAKALFGDDVEAELGIFAKQRTKLIIAAQRYAELAHIPERTSAERDVKRFEEKQAIQNIIWEGWGDKKEDQFGIEIDGAIEMLESHLIPIVRDGADPDGPSVDIGNWLRKIAGQAA